MNKIHELFDKDSVKKERTHDVEMFYSDSARVQVKITSPLLVRFKEKQNVRDEFPEGMLVEFFDNNQKVKSWLKADYAERHDNDGLIIVRKNVILYNSRNEKLETSELFWDEKRNVLHTEKFVMITRPSKGDTSLGFGILIDEDFNRFEIKNKFSAKLRMEEIAKALENENPEEENGT